MTDLGTYQVRFPDMEISFPEPQFRVDAGELRDQLRAKFLAGMADVYDRHAEVARQKYNAIDPATERPPIARGKFIAVKRKTAPKKRAAKPAAKRKNRKTTNRRK